MLHNPILLPKQILTSSQEGCSRPSPKVAISFPTTLVKITLFILLKRFWVFLIWVKRQKRNKHPRHCNFHLKIFLAHNSLLSSELSEAGKNSIIYPWATPKCTEIGIYSVGYTEWMKWWFNFSCNHILLSGCLFLKTYWLIRAVLTSINSAQHSGYTQSSYKIPWADTRNLAKNIPLG